MRGHLFDNFYVEIDPGVHRKHGSWSRKPPYRATDQGLLKLFYEQLKRIENPIALDIGASTGSFCLLAAIHEMRVHAFEPNREAYGVLMQNIVLNELEDRISAYPIALSNMDRKVYLKVPVDGNPALSTLGEPKLFKKWRRVKIWVRKLDSLALGRVDIIKSDTEGNEYNVLLGAEETIRKYKPGLLLEYHTKMASQFGYKPEKILELLKSWGYNHFQRCGRLSNDLWAEYKMGGVG